MNQPCSKETCLDHTSEVANVALLAAHADLRDVLPRGLVPRYAPVLGRLVCCVCGSRRAPTHARVRARRPPAWACVVRKCVRVRTSDRAEISGKVVRDDHSVGLGIGVGFVNW